LTLETCPSNLVVVVAHLTNVTNLRKIGQKCGRYRRRKVCADTHTYPQVMLYLSSAMNCIGQTSKYLTGMCLVCCLWRVVSNRPRRHARPRWPTLHRPPPRRRHSIPHTVFLRTVSFPQYITSSQQRAHRSWQADSIGDEHRATVDSVLAKRACFCAQSCLTNVGPEITHATSRPTKRTPTWQRTSVNKDSQ